MELETTTVIDRPIAEVFARFAEVERFSEWIDDVVERRKLTDGPIRVGTQYHAVDQLPLGRRLEGTLEITAYEPNERVAARLSPPFNLTWDTRFAETEAGTRMTMRVVLNWSGIPGLLASVFSGLLKRRGQRGLNKFKAGVESVLYSPP